jgi:uncharacterized repeat protein (TIGR01451 family)
MRPFIRTTRRFRLHLFIIGLTVAFVTGRVSPVEAEVTWFAPGSLIIPMDTDDQDGGMLRAYGLVYELLANGVPVSWAINPTKLDHGDDVVVGLPATLFDFRIGINPGGVILTTPSHHYRGGPFLIAASDADAALPIIQAWQATPGDNTAVHLLREASINADVAFRLVRAPRIAILQDGNELIAFNNLNAAGIRDASGELWSASSPDVLSEADIAGSSSTVHDDGALFLSAGASRVARYCYFASMHYNSAPNTPEVVAEVRSWLGSTSSANAFMQCQSISTFENFSPFGHFLTTGGLAVNGLPPSTPVLQAWTNPLGQIDGSFEADAGVVAKFSLALNSSFDSLTTTIINQFGSTLLNDVVLLTGHLDGDSGKGTVTYLGGHDYSVSLPISLNPETNGVRVFLNSIFASACATDPGQQDASLTMSAPANISPSDTILYTITYTNPAPNLRPIETVTITDTLPPGATYVAGSATVAPATIVDGELTWRLPALEPGASVSVSFSANVTADGSYTNVAQMRYTDLTVRTLASVATTVRTTPVYNFSGFFQPVDNPPTLNEVKAGQGVPITFSLNGNQGLDILAGSPVSAQTACDGSAPVDTIETSTSGNSGLTYDAASNTYTYVWKTEKIWANSCRQWRLTLADGTLHVANFRFK